MPAPKIDPEFKRLLPALTPDEYNGLQADIEEHGCREPVSVWNDIIVDGMSRWEICAALGKPCPTKPIEFADRDAAKAWMIRHQMGRRNLTAGQRATLAAQLAAVRGPGRPDNSANLRDEKSIPTAAKEMQVSPRAVNQARAVIADGSPKLQEAVRDGKIPVSTAAKIVNLPKSEQTRLAAQGKAAVAKAAKAPPPPEEPITPKTDQLGHALPADNKEIADVFSRREEITHLMSDLSRIKAVVQKAVKAKDPLYARISLSDFETAIERARANLKGIRPHGVCCYCAGDGCRACKNHGWLGVWEYEAAPKEMQ